MWRSFVDTYRTAARFMRTCPILFLVPALPELAQHAVEYRIGLFASMAAFKASEHDSLRLIFGSIKVLGLLVPGYWITRFAWLGSGIAARKRDRISHFLLVFLYGSVLAFTALWLPIAIGGISGARLGISLSLASLILDTLLAQWMGRAALGDGQPGPMQSIRTVGPMFFWALLFRLTAILPLFAFHYALNFLCFGKPPVLLFSLLLIDSVVVCLLTAAIWVAYVEISRRAQAKALC